MLITDWLNWREKEMTEQCFEFAERDNEKCAIKRWLMVILEKEVWSVGVLQPECFIIIFTELGCYDKNIPLCI